VAQAACRFLDLSEERTAHIVLHTMDPDRNLRFMNRYVQDLRARHAGIFDGERPFTLNDVFSLHSHKKASRYSLFFARVSRRLAQAGLQEEADVTLSYAIHYLVDCATPMHAFTLASLRDLIVRRHRRYEDHLEDLFKRGAHEMLASLHEGIEKGIEEHTRYAHEHAHSLTQFSCSLYRPLLQSIKDRKDAEVEEISKRVFKRLGADMAPFLVTFCLL
jgi:macrodomain Ter protein organizer (MatP/YcbG family)